VASATKIFEGLGPSTLIPQRGKTGGPALDGLGPEEGFVLSRVDGHTTLEEICLLVPFDPPVTQVILRRLFEAGAIDVPGVARTLPSPRSSGNVPIVKPTLDSVPLYVERALESEAHRIAALTAEQQKRIDGFFAGLEQFNAFQLLETEVGADAKTIKRAYFKLSKEFHPDRYFQKEIGEYKDKLSKIFQAIKAAFELLSDPNRRKAYEESTGLKK
jgi:hypothetical protein